MAKITNCEFNEVFCNYLNIFIYTRVSLYSIKSKKKTLSKRFYVSRDWSKEKQEE